MNQNEMKKMISKPGAQEILDEYCENELYKLKSICNSVLSKMTNVSNMYYDDFYSAALDILCESILRFNNDMDCKFSTFLTGNIKRKFWTKWRDMNRQKVMPQKGIGSLYDILYENETELINLIPSDFCLEDEVIKDLEIWHNETKEFLSMLSPLQKNIALLISEGLDKEKICKELKISETHYHNSIKRIFADEKTKILIPLLGGR